MSIFRIVFAIVATLVLIGINVYIYKRFLRKIDFFQNYKKIIKYFVLTISICEILFFLLLEVVV